MTPGDLDRLITALEKAKEEGFPIDALLEAFKTAHTELVKWIDRFTKLAAQPYSKDKDEGIQHVIDKINEYNKWWKQPDAPGVRPLSATALAHLNHTKRRLEHILENGGFN
jgi:hypothetical protein